MRSRRSKRHRQRKIAEAVARKMNGRQFLDDFVFQMTPMTVNITLTKEEIEAHVEVAGPRR